MRCFCCGSVLAVIVEDSAAVCRISVDNIFASSVPPRLDLYGAAAVDLHVGSPVYAWQPAAADTGQPRSPCAIRSTSTCFVVPREL